MRPATLDEYTALMRSFVEGGMTALEFESAYLSLFKNDSTLWSGPEFTILDGLFADVDAFVADPTIRDEGDLDEAQLKDRASEALAKLGSLREPSPSS